MAQNKANNQNRIDLDDEELRKNHCNLSEFRHN